MIQECSGCHAISGETNQVGEDKEPFFLCAKCEIESESANCCEICGKVIDEDKGDFESTDTYIEGNYEDTMFVHTECRYNEEQKPKLYLKKRIGELQKRLDDWSNHSPAGQTAYSILQKELETYLEIAKLLDYEIVEKKIE